MLEFVLSLLLVISVCLNLMLWDALDDWRRAAKAAQRWAEQEADLNTRLISGGISVVIARKVRK